MLLRRILILNMIATLSQCVFVNIGHATSTDELIGKAANITTALARGNVSGAANQMIGGYAIPVAPRTNTTIYASPSHVGIQQPIRPLGVRNPYVNVGTAYQASVNPLRPTNVSQNVQMNAGNSYFSNTTTVPVPTNFKRE